MGLFNTLNISNSALQAERLRAEVAASNLANAETTHTAQGGPYRKQSVVFGSARVAGSNFAESLNSAGDAPARGVRVERVVTDKTDPIRRYDPSHPDADKDGYVSYPNINPIAEMVDLMGASRAYQMNVSATQATKAMITSALDILR